MRLPWPIEQIQAHPNEIHGLESLVELNRFAVVRAAVAAFFVCLGKTWL